MRYIKDIHANKKGVNMIDLQVAEYCQECTEFVPSVEKIPLYNGYNEKCSTHICCMHSDKCRRIVEYLQKEISTNEK